MVLGLCSRASALFSLAAYPFPTLLVIIAISAIVYYTVERPAIDLGKRRGFDPFLQRRGKDAWPTMPPTIDPALMPINVLAITDMVVIGS